MKATILMATAAIVFGAPLVAQESGAAGGAGTPPAIERAAGPERGGERRPGHAGPVTQHIDFEAIDADGDGVLDRAELENWAVARIGEFDANGDGLLDREELAATYPARTSGLANVFGPDRGFARADRILEQFGAAEAGGVAVQEMANRNVNALLARFDRNHDGAIERAEAEFRGERHDRGDRRPAPRRS